MPAITVENISKKYRKGQLGYRTLREDLYNLTGQLIHLRRGNRQSYDERYMWALKDVSFQVEKGEKLGIIGANGSGKTTLLRLLAGITRPTEGKISLKGRMGVLIELMAGFHPELTGRENIFLNGAIMGMSRKEIQRKFDEIVSFAGIEEWVNTPIKRYSSGMHVRLGFAVSAHLDPDILLVDEVLAVGDAAFQRKCLVKMDDVAGGGRTVLFVSHNMGSIKSLCDRVIILDRGKLLDSYPSAEGVELYLSQMQEYRSKTPLRDRSDRKGSGEVRIVDAWLTGDNGRRLTHVPLDIGALSFHIALESQRVINTQGIAIGVYNSLGLCVFWLDSRALLGKLPLESGLNHVSCSLPSGFALAMGQYIVNIAVFSTFGLIDHVSQGLTFDVTVGDFYGTGRDSGGDHIIYVQQQWLVQ